MTDDHKLKRREFLKSAGLGAAAAGTAAAGIAAPAIAQGKRQLTMVTTWQKNFPGLGTSAERLAQRITAATDGQLTVKLYAAGELVPAFGAFDAVSAGSADMYHGAEYYWQGKSKGFNFFTSVPFGLNAAEMNAWIYYGGGQELWDQLSAQFNIKAFMASNTGNQMGGWFRKEINTLEDFKGLTIRMPGLGGEVMNRLGATPTALAADEIYTSLQQGRIDATEWVGPWNDLAFGFYKITPFYYWPGFHEPGASLACGINLDVWNSFTKPQQEIVKACCAAENDHSLAEFNHNNTAALNTLINEHGVKLRRFSDEIIREMARLSADVVREAGEENDLNRQIYESFLAARTSGRAWSELSEEGYIAARRLGLGEAAPAAPGDAE